MLYWFLLSLNLILWLLLAYFQWDNDWRAKADRSPLFKSPILDRFFAGCQLIIMFGPALCAWRFAGQVPKILVMVSVVAAALIMNLTWAMIGRWSYGAAVVDYEYIVKQWRHERRERYALMTDVEIEEESQRIVLQNAKDNEVFDDKDDEQVKPVTHR